MTLVTDPIHNLVFIFFFGYKGTTFFETTKFYGIFSVTITIISIFHCNLDFGTQRRDSGKRINNEDKENGILSGTK